MDNETPSWLQVPEEPELTPEEVLAQNKAEKAKNEEFESRIKQISLEMKKHHFYTDKELCEMGQEDFVRERRNNE